MELATVDKLLTTTRAVRRRLDLSRPVEPGVIQECLDIAIQAPTGSNAQGWHFVVVTDAAKRARIGKLYRDSFFIYARSREDGVGTQTQDKVYERQQTRVVSSAVYLANHMGEVPVLIIPCIQSRVENQGVME